MSLSGFSANLGFLWPELSLVDRVYAAKKAGFDAVECHFPYDTPVAELKQALDDTALPMLGLNTRLGGDGDFGVAAIAGRESQAREYIDEAVAYATALSCRHVNVVPGKTSRSTSADAVCIDNLTYACQLAARHRLSIVIEPLNTRSVPGAYLHTLDHAIELITAVDADNLKLMFDCFHMQIMHGNVTSLLLKNLASIAHIQFAAVPDRAEPDSGELDYPVIFGELQRAGWSGFLGAEYHPVTTTDEGLGWLGVYQQELTKQ